MPRSRKRHHSRSRSKTRSKSPSRDRSYEKQKKPSSHEKDGKRRRLDEVIDSPLQKRSLSFHDDELPVKDVEQPTSIDDPSKIPNSDRKQDDGLETMKLDDGDVCNADIGDCVVVEKNKHDLEPDPVNLNESDCESLPETSLNLPNVETKIDNKTRSENEEIVISDSDDVQMEVIYDKKEKLTTPKKPLTPKQLQKRIESEKKKQQKQQERDEREKQRQDEKAKLLAEKQKMKEQKEAERLKILEEKNKQLELKQKEKEWKEEQRKKEKEEKEQKRKEKEEQEAQKRKEKEIERLKKLQEVEEKKQKEEEKKQKTAALFINFFKKTEAEEKETKAVKVNSNFMPFEVKSDMRLPPLIRKHMSPVQIKDLDFFIQNQDENVSYLKDLKCGKIQPGKSTKTWPYEDPEDEITVIEEDKTLGETIGEDKPVVLKMKAKFLCFHDNRRPAYFGTWRKSSKLIKPRRPFEEDTDTFNYEEDSDDDWEEEEQGESLEISGDEEEKDTENDDYEVDDEFFVPHGHLSDDEVDDDENARLSPASLKQKLKLLKDEFEEDIKSKTHKLKPRSIGGVWLNKHGDHVDDAIYRYLLPFAMIVVGPKEIKNRSEVFASPAEKKRVKTMVELPNEHIPFFLKIIHGNINNKKTLIEEFLTFMCNNGFTVEVSKANLTRFLKSSATYRRSKDEGPMKNKFGWFVNDDIKEKYNVNLDLCKT